MRRGFPIAALLGVALAAAFWLRPAADEAASDASPAIEPRTVEAGGTPSAPPRTEAGAFRGPGDAPSAGDREIELPHGYPTWEDLPASQRPAAARGLALRLEDWLDEHEGADKATVGEPDCAMVPCLVPVSIPADDVVLYGLVTAAASEVAGARTLTVPQRIEDGSMTLWLYWNAPIDEEGEWGSQFQLIANQRVMAR